MYSLNYTSNGNVGSIQRGDTCIPICKDNTDYQDFLEWNKSQKAPLVLNSVYKPTKEEVIAKTNAEIYLKLNAIDLKSIRAIREGDLIYIEKYKVEAEKLRSQIL